MKPAETVLQALAGADGQAPAIAGDGQPVLTHAALRALVDKTIRTLNISGIGHGDRVAIVLPNGPAMATAFIAIAAGATAAPLNPAYTSDEFEFYLSDLKAKALVTGEGMNSPAVEVARKLGVRLITLSETATGGAGDFTLSIPDSAPANLSGPAQANDIALVLHTSGTTSRPKIVPLSQRNICLSAANIKATLRLEATDRALNIMPLFHIHGLIAGLLAPLSAGGAIFATPGFNALKFFSWMAAWRPTWYTAVPTMHQAILSRAPHNADIIAANPLRFIRSSSSALPPQVIAELERTFHTPVVEAYGMTEAAHQMASNPLPPARAKPGTVGLAAGPEIAVADSGGNLLPAGATGEIVIRGANVTAGYENNPAANEEAFREGWFRTGDQGVMDADGYLSITGRLKEIINRGGEKISPREVDDVLMDHPAVQQVVTFAIPHDKLGETVGAVVVLREGASATERQLRDFAGQRLAAFKVPQQILFRDEIPKGATGKLQRIGLAAKLGLV